PAPGGADDDRLHRPDLPRRREQLRPRVLLVLRGRARPVRPDADADARRSPHPRALPGGLPMTVSLTRVEGAHERRLDEIGASRRPGSRQRTDRRFAAVCVLGAVLSLALLAVLLAAIGVLGAPHLDADFLAAW